MFGVRAPFCVSVFDVCEKCFNFIRILFCVTISAERKPSRCMSRCQRDNDEIEMEKKRRKTNENIQNYSNRWRVRNQNSDSIHIRFSSSFFLSVFFFSSFLISIIVVVIPFQIQLIVLCMRCVCLCMVRANILYSLSFPLFSGQSIGEWLYGSACETEVPIANVNVTSMQVWIIKWEIIRGIIFVSFRLQSAEGDLARHTPTQNAIDGYGHDKIQCSLAYHLLLAYANGGGNGGGGGFCF